ncbi:MAG: LptA/OstA family protein [Candidatus Polarisedimenticolia bacterium]
MRLVRNLKIIVLTGLGALVVAVALSLPSGARTGQPEGPALPPGSVIDPADSIVQQGTRVRLDRTRAGAPTLKLRAATSRTRASGALELQDVSFALYGAGGGPTHIEAPEAITRPGTPRVSARTDEPAGSGSKGNGFSPELGNGAGSWLLSGGVTVTGPGELRLTVQSLTYDEGTGVASSADSVSFSRGSALGSSVGMEFDVGKQVVRFLRDVAASMTVGGLGEVSVRAGKASYETRVRHFRMEQYRAETSRGEILTGRSLLASFREQGGLDLLEGGEGFELTTTHAVPVTGDGSPLSRLLALEGRRTMRGQTLIIHMDADERPREIQVLGEASLRAGSKGSEQPSSLDARTLILDLTRGILTRARASGDVALSKPPADGEAAGFRMKSENLDASFDPQAGSLLRVAGEGHIQLWDQGIESQGSRTFLEPGTNVVTLIGDGDVPARVTWTGRVIEARRIDVDRRSQTLIAREGVRASYTPGGPPSGKEAQGTSGPLPFFRSDRAIHAVADRLTVGDDGRTARYEGHVRLWQDESRLEAGQVEVREGEGTLTAGDDVTTTFRQPPQTPAAGPRSPTDDIITVSSRTVSFRRGEDRVEYSGRVLVTQGPTRVTSERLTVYLEPGTSTARRIDALQDVEVRERGRVGRGDRLEVDLRMDTLKLSGSGREAVVQDELNQQVVRGSSLTMDRAGDRILVESELGGRTWITLKPRQKGAPAVGSDPNN